MEATGGSERMSANEYDKIITTLGERFSALNIDKNFLDVAKSHLETLADPDSSDRQKFLVAKLFWLKKDMFPENVPFEVKDDPDLPIVYLKNEDVEDARRKHLSKTRSFSDILHLEVSDVMPDEYELKLISFIPATSNLKTKLDDLSLFAYLRKTPSEVKALGGELKVLDLIRAIPAYVDNRNQKLYVTVQQEENSAMQLGKISEESAFVYDNLSGSKFSSYEEAFNVIGPKFPSSKWMTNAMANTGIDPHKTYSFHRKWNGKQYSPETYAEELLKKAKIETATSLINKAEKCGEFVNALEILDKAAEICPENPAVYEVRGKIYAEQVCDFKKAALDFERALHLNPKSIIASKEYAKILYMTSRYYYKRKNYKRAAESLFASLELNEDGEISLAYLKKLKKRLPEMVIKWEFLRLTKAYLRSVDPVEGKKIKQQMKRLIYTGFIVKEEVAAFLSRYEKKRHT